MARTLGLAFACASSIAATSSAGIVLDVSTGDPHARITGHSTYAAVATGDLNGDGRDDLVFTGRQGEMRIVLGRSCYPEAVDVSSGYDIHIVGVASSFEPLPLVVADLNGDGIEDLLVRGGSPRPNARAIIVFGRPAWPSFLDLAVTDPDVTFVAAGGIANFTTLAAADFNGDGWLDVLAGSPGAITMPGSGPHGKVHVFHGRAAWPAVWDLNVTPPDVDFVGTNCGTFRGSGLGDFDLATGDVNGDGFADVVTWATEEPNCFFGLAVILYGGAALPPVTFLSATPPTRLFGPWGGGQGDLDVGDLNGDGFADILIGDALFDYLGRQDCGRAHIVLGSASLPPIIDLGVPGTSIQFYGGAPADTLGVYSFLGDVNNDGIDDLLLDAPLSPGLPPPGLRRGALTVFFGRPVWPPETDLATDYGDILVTSSVDQSTVGAWVTVGDFNGRGGQDFSVSSDQPLQTSLFFGDGNTRPPAFPAPPAPPTSVSSCRTSGPGFWRRQCTDSGPGRGGSRHRIPEGRWQELLALVSDWLVCHDLPGDPCAALLAASGDACAEARRDFVSLLFDLAYGRVLESCPVAVDGWPPGDPAPATVAEALERAPALLRSGDAASCRLVSALVRGVGGGGNGPSPATAGRARGRAQSGSGPSGVRP